MLSKRRLKGLSGSALGFGFGLSWETVPGDREAAKAVLSQLEDRRLLFGSRHVEDEAHCIQSALAIRRDLTEVLARGATGPSLSASLRMLRAACRDFVSKGGPDGRDFERSYGPDVDRFSMALGELRALFGQQIGLLSTQFDIPIDEELAIIVVWPLPEDDDPSWLPGFDYPG